MVVVWNYKNKKGDNDEIERRKETGKIKDKVSNMMHEPLRQADKTGTKRL